MTLGAGNCRRSVAISCSPTLTASSSWTMWNWCRYAATTGLGLTGPLADEVLGASGPAHAVRAHDRHRAWSGMAWTCASCRGYGDLAPHYELWVPRGASSASCGSDLRTAGATSGRSRGARSLPHRRRHSRSTASTSPSATCPRKPRRLRALHFNKGCYLGQEIVERIRSRGNVHRHLRQLEMRAHSRSGSSLTGKCRHRSRSRQITSAADCRLAANPRAFALAMSRARSRSCATSPLPTSPARRRAPPAF